MNRARLAFAASVVGLGLSGLVAAQTPAPAPAPPAPQMQSVLAGKKFTPPIRGAADVEFLPPKTAKTKDMVVTKIQVRNASTAPIPRLTIDETWYDKAGNTIAGGKGVINGLLQPGEIQTVVIETPWRVGMLSNNYNFTHANGVVKPKKVSKFEGAEEEKAPAKAAAKPAATKK